MMACSLDAVSYKSQYQNGNKEKYSSKKECFTGRGKQKNTRITDQYLKESSSSHCRNRARKVDAVELIIAFEAINTLYQLISIFFNKIIPLKRTE